MLLPCDGGKPGHPVVLAATAALSVVNPFRTPWDRVHSAGTARRLYPPRTPPRLRATAPPQTTAAPRLPAWAIISIDAMARLFAPVLPDWSDGGRLGGAPPQVIEQHPLFDTHRYVLTLPSDCAPWTGGAEVSVLLRVGFDIGDEDIVYPNMAMRALLHESSPRGTRTQLGWPGLRATELAPVTGESESGLVRIAQEPSLIQGDPSYADAVLADGHRFLFQIDEEGWPVEGPLEDVIDDYLWGYGSVYFYGTPDPTDDIVREIVAGFIDF